MSGMLQQDFCFLKSLSRRTWSTGWQGWFQYLKRPVSLVSFCIFTSAGSRLFFFFLSLSFLRAFPSSPSPTFIYHFTGRVVWPPSMTSQLNSSICLCSPLPSGTWRTPGLSTPWRCLPISSSVCLSSLLFFCLLVFFPFSLCLARWFWPDLIDGRLVHTTSVCVSLGQEVFVWSDCLNDPGTDFLFGNMAFVRDA